MAIKKENRYSALLEKVFFDGYSKGGREVFFAREDLVKAAKTLSIKTPKNLGDIVYSARYRTSLSDAILATQPDGLEWVIEGTGRAEYVFRLQKISRILPNENLIAIKIPDATPEIIEMYALTDEQALLAKVRYNRLVDIFLGITCYSLQNHLRTTVKSIGQIEIDEVYVGVDKRGAQFVIPVQAKGGSDKLGIVQAKQDIECCAEKFPGMICRALSTQFMSGNLIAIFELTVDEGELRIVEERHYRLVEGGKITKRDLARYSS